VGELPFSPAAERNRGPILAVLQAQLPARARVLELASGTGQHAEHFAAAEPGWDWQPSEHPAALATLNLRLLRLDLPNLRPARALDVADRGAWPPPGFDAVYAANLAHIAAWSAVEAMFAGVAGVLQPAGRFCLYGPFHRDGQPTSPGNAAFDAQLRDPGNPAGTHQGVRDDRALFALAAAHGLACIADVAMPANNRTLVFQGHGDACPC
jgi:SAM-dependent methyltransferase